MWFPRSRPEKSWVQQDLAEMGVDYSKNNSSAHWLLKAHPWPGALYTLSLILKEVLQLQLKKLRLREAK